jgi:hypothetical protein
MECANGAVACLAPGSVRASMPVGGGPVVAVTPESARAQRFAEMLQAEPQRESVYVATADVAPSSNNALKSLATQFQAFELPNSMSAPAGMPVPAGRYEQANVNPELDPVLAVQESMRKSQQELIQFQAHMVRTSMMMDVMNSAKQGVTTLFQQQG